MSERFVRSFVPAFLVCSVIRVFVCMQGRLGGLAEYPKQDSAESDQFGLQLA